MRIALLLDLTVVAVFLVTVILDTWRGFVKSFMHLASGIVSLLFAYAMTPRLGDWLFGYVVRSNIASGIATTLRGILPDSGEATLETILNSPVFQEIAKRYHVTADSVAAGLNGSESAEELVAKLSDSIVAPVAGIISNAAAFLLLFVGAMVVLRLLTWLLDLVFRIPVLSGANRVLGFALGVLSALLVCWVLAEGIGYLVTALGPVSETYFGADVIEQTVIIRFFQTHHLLGSLTGLLGGTPA